MHKHNSATKKNIQIVVVPHCQGLKEEMGNGLIKITLHKAMPPESHDKVDVRAIPKTA